MKCQSKRNAVNVTAMCFAKLVSLLVNSGGTIKECAQEIGICTNAARRYVLALHREGLIHVGRYGFDRAGRSHPHLKIYVWGHGKDVEYVPVSWEQYLQSKRDWRRRRKEAGLLKIYKRKPKTSPQPEIHAA